MRLSGGGDGAVDTYIQNMLDKEKQLVYDQCEANAHRLIEGFAKVTTKLDEKIVVLEKENEELKRALYFWTAVALERG